MRERGEIQGPVRRLRSYHDEERQGCSGVCVGGGYGVGRQGDRVLTLKHLRKKRERVCVREAGRGEWEGF